MSVSATPTEQAILTDLRERTGLRMPRLQALLRLPLADYLRAIECLIPWVDKVDEAHRGAIYSVFGSKQAAQFLPMLLRWREKETDRVALSGLLQVINRLMTPRNADSILRSINPAAPEVEEVWILANLTRFAATGEKAVDILLALIRTGRMPLVGWSDVARVRHPGIRSWLDQHRAEFVWRADIRRALGETVPLPPGASKTRREPRLDRTVERFDTDVQDIAAVIKSLEQKHMIRFPSGFAPTDVPMWLSEETWVRLPALDAAVELLLRQEDWSTIELALVRTKSTKSTKILGAYPACSDAKLAPSKEE